eukprot:jgi/Botrbrau1/14801/Bobra.105_1s0013.1
MVVGGGYAGVELAATLAEQLPPPSLVSVLTMSSDIMEGSPEGQRAAANDSLRRKGVDVLTQAKVTGIRPISDSPKPRDGRRTVSVQLGAGQKSDFPVDLVIWAAGSGPITRTAAEKLSLPFPTSSRGNIQIEPTLQVVGNSRVFALGDVAGVVPGGEEAITWPSTAQVAFQQADYVAWNLWASINGRPLLPFKYQHLGDMMSLGKASGAVTLPVKVPQQVAEAVRGGPFQPLLDLGGCPVDVRWGMGRVPG